MFFLSLSNSKNSCRIKREGTHDLEFVRIWVLQIQQLSKSSAFSRQSGDFLQEVDFYCGYCLLYL